MPLSETHALALSPAAAIRTAVALVDGLPGYEVTEVDGSSALITREYRPTWALVLAASTVLGFLPGLLALAIKREEALRVVAFAREDRGSELTVDGIASGELVTRLRATLGAPARARG